MEVLVGAVEALACRQQIEYSTTINAGQVSIDGCSCADGYFRFWNVKEGVLLHEQARLRT